MRSRKNRRAAYEAIIVNIVLLGLVRASPKANQQCPRQTLASQLMPDNALPGLAETSGWTFPTNNRLYQSNSSWSVLQHHCQFNYIYIPEHHPKLAAEQVIECMLTLVGGLSKIKIKLHDSLRDMEVCHRPRASISPNETHSKFTLIINDITNAWACIEGNCMQDSI